MNMNKEQKILNAGVNGVKVFFAICVILALTYFVVGQVIPPDERDRESENYKTFVSDWYQVMEDGERVLVEVPGDAQAESGETPLWEELLQIRIFFRLEAFLPHRDSASVW